MQIGASLVQSVTWMKLVKVMLNQNRNLNNIGFMESMPDPSTRSWIRTSLISTLLPPFISLKTCPAGARLWRWMWSAPSCPSAWTPLPKLHISASLALSLLLFLLRPRLCSFFKAVVSEKQIQWNVELYLWRKSNELLSFCYFLLTNDHISDVFNVFKH